jgi:hypothetical protein
MQTGASAKKGQRISAPSDSPRVQTNGSRRDAACFYCLPLPEPEPELDPVAGAFATGLRSAK